MNDVLILALDSGTSVVKAVAFDASGNEVAQAARPNHCQQVPHGGVEQDMAATAADALEVLAELIARLDGRRVAALAVTGQGDGTWLIDAAGNPTGPAMLWLDGRAGAIVESLRASPAAGRAFAHTGTGLNTCQQSAQLLWLAQADAPRLAAATTAFHCKDWLYFVLTGVRATDPSEACFTFGDWRGRVYDEEVIEALGLSALRGMLPPIVDGARSTHPLRPDLAARLGLRAGLPVVLGYVDVVCTALGAGLGADGAGVSILGSTGMHMRLARGVAQVVQNGEQTGYTMCLPLPAAWAQMQTNMAATLNIDWLVGLVAEAQGLSGDARPKGDILALLDSRVMAGQTNGALFHPYLSTAGERGPFVDADARGSLFGIERGLGLIGLARAIYEGLAFAALDCFMAMGGPPAAVLVTGGAARSAAMRGILAATLDRPVRRVAQAEAGAAGAAMIAAVALGLFTDIGQAAEVWVAPRLGPPEKPDPTLSKRYAAAFPLYRESRRNVAPIWKGLAALREMRHGA
ncbi:MAG: FGGY family carbohydrate kinase [Acetobacteraceae bacterium]